MPDTAFWTPHTGRLRVRVPVRLPAAGWRPGTNRTGLWSGPRAFCDGASGLVSTAGDLLAFTRMLLRGGDPVLTGDAVAEMTRDQLTPAQKARGGLGPGFFDEISWGFCTSVVTAGAGPRVRLGWRLRHHLAGGSGQDLTVIVLTQRMFDSPQPPPVHEALQAAAYAALA